MHIRSKRTLIVLAAVLIGGGAIAAGFAWSSTQDRPPSATPSSGPTAGTPSPSASAPGSGSTALPSPTAVPVVPPPDPTPTVEPTTTPSPTDAPTPVLAPVDVVTTFAAWNASTGAIEVGGYANVVEPAGSCTLRLTQGDRVVTRAVGATTDATTVACGGFSVPGSDLTSGRWQAVLAYASTTSTGTGKAVEVTVP